MTGSHRNIVIWLAAGCILIFAMVIIGGITRLTGSGLSITEWKLIRGTIPPLNAQQWNEEFENYKQIPQYKELNYNYTLNDFKKIYFWEYLHRLIGRVIGLVFIIPFLYFYFTRQLSPFLIKRLLLIFFLGAFQGVLGWYMVKSGLVHNVRVSHLRLAAHLITAFATFGFIFWVMLGIIFPLKAKPNKFILSLKKIILLILFFTVLQIIYGAFTAGLKAGHIYNTFPKMGDEWIAGAVSYSLQTEGLTALINNMATVQFIHRCIAWLLAMLILFAWLYSGRKNEEDNSPVFSLIQKQAVNFLMMAVVFQFILGVFALICNVPVVLGVLHQSGAFILFSSVIYALHAVKYSSPEF